MRIATALLAVYLASSSVAGAQGNEATIALDQFLERNASDVEACFAGAPDMLAPQGVASRGVATAAPTPRSLVVVVDGSGSMAGTMGGVRKMDAARLVVQSFLASVPSDVEIGLVVFGHRGNNHESGRDESCSGVETLVPIGPNGRVALSTELNAIEPTGWTPLADALASAREAFGNGASEGERVVYVVSDGRETCGGDPIEAARMLNESDLRAVVNVIGFDLEPADRAQLAAVAEAGGGTFEDVRAVDADKALARMRATVDNRSGGVGAAVSNARRQIRNTRRTATATNQLLQCVGRSLNDETKAFQRYRKELGDPALARAAYAALRERHAAYRDAARGDVDALDALRQRANDRIDRKNRTNERMIHRAAPAQ